MKNEKDFIKSYSIKVEILMDWKHRNVTRRVSAVNEHEAKRIIKKQMNSEKRPVVRFKEIQRLLRKDPPCRYERIALG